MRTMMPQVVRSVFVAALTACALRPLPAQTVSSSNPYLRMCDGVARPVAADSVKNYRPAVTTTGTLCWVVRTAAAVTPIDTTKRDTVTPPPTTLALITDRGPALAALNWGIAPPGSPYVTSTLDPTGQPALRMLFPAGMISGVSSATVYYGPSFSVATIRWESVIAYDVNYAKHTSSVDKSVFVGVDGRNKMYTMMYDPTRLIPAIGLQEIANFGGATNLTPNLGVAVELQRGKRYTLACEATANTAGTANGVVECWLDGVKFLRRADIQFSAGAARFTHVHWAPIWGGAGPALAREQSVYLGALRVYGR